MPKTTRNVQFTLNVTGTAYVELEDIVGDVPLEKVDLEAAKTKAQEALDGCEFNIILSDPEGDLPFTISLDLK